MQNKEKYNLEERTAKFGENVILMCKRISVDIISKPIISQLIRSSTSVGANYAEADDAVSSKDFANKIGISKKEARETKHHLRMLATAVPYIKKEIGVLWKEANELNLILNSIYRKVKSKNL
ncbi:MAG: four helix bundle protein [Candidatus Dojkabacteria bacterium]|nr:four helix bundle protein [Candidatus Dojkabacteria bacterium]MDQ7020984.1 four helix bundle protein [Candidatus Dojkabacteria bacterium]